MVTPHGFGYGQPAQPIDVLGHMKFAPDLLAFSDRIFVGLFRVSVKLL